MKYLPILALLAVMTASCNRYDEPQEEKDHAMYMSYETLRSSVAMEPACPIGKRGKISIYNSLLLINEPNKGVHLFDNSNPALPIPLGFLNVPGNVDMAVNHGILYLDSFIDLIAVELTADGKAIVRKRIENHFDYNANQALQDNEYLRNYDKSKGVVIGYAK